MSYTPRAAARQPNLYEYLQVSPRADGVVIQAAYRALARHYHPDVSASANAQRIMREINAAYHVLNDPARRARYDAFRERYHRPPVRRPVDARPAPAARMSIAAVGPTSSSASFGAAANPRAVVVLVLVSGLTVVLMLMAIALMRDALDDRLPDHMTGSQSQQTVVNSVPWVAPLDTLPRR